MSVPDEVMSYIRDQKGIVGVFEMDDDVSRDVDAIEKSIKTRTNHDYVSIGYDIAMERKHRLCVFYTDDFEKEFRARLQLMTTDGTVMGMNLMPEELNVYRDREDVLFVSDDFIVFPEIHGEGEEMFVLYPYEYEELHSIVPGCRNAIGFSPTPSSDHYLKERTRTEESQFIYTTIVAFDD